MASLCGVCVRETCCFYPTALKGCRGIVFTHGVQMGRRAGFSGGQREIVRPGCISETVRCKEVHTWRGHWLGGVGVQRHGLTLI